MAIIKIDERTLNDLSDYGVAEVWVELSADGSVLREIGFNSSGLVVHRYPGEGPHGRFGIFDLAKFSYAESEVGEEEFNSAWQGLT